MDFCDFKEKIFVLRGQKVYVGFSGGADSLALLLIMQYFEKEYDYELIAVHFEHGIRGEESLRDMEFCKKFCEERAIKLQIYPLDVLKNKLDSESIESCARRLRHETYKNLEGDGLKYVVLGHHQNDAMENLFIRIFRGGNVSSLVNLQEFSERERVCYYRPLLHHAKEEIIEFLHKNGVIQYCYDSTNSDNNYLRNFVRNEFLAKLKKQFPESYAGISRCYESLLDDATYLEKSARLEFLKIHDSEVVTNDFYKNLDNALIIRVLRYYLSKKTGEDFIPNRAWIDKFKSIVECSNSVGKKIEINNLYNYVCHREGWRLEMQEEDTPLFNMEWDYIANPQIICNNQKVFAKILTEYPTTEELKELSLSEKIFDADIVGEKLLLTPRQEGDKIIRFGKTTPVKIKKLIIDRKLSQAQKQKLIFFRNLNGEIVFVSGLEHGENGKINEKSRKIIKIWVEKI